ncbi:MAG TPA: ABC transporter permease [Gammaproteobacteria bacterium]|nr:ABC transporter permease [Gammaproteobacteria bacterium]
MSLRVIVAKDLRLLFRDRVALAFIALAPIVVISVAGFSLASLYGGDRAGQTAYDLPIVDEDGGGLAKEITERLSDDASVRVRAVASRDEAERLVATKAAGSALVIPRGTAAALAAGEPARVLLYTDPVKYLERLNVRLRVLQARDELADTERERVAQSIAEQRESLRAELEKLGAAIRTARSELDAAKRESQELGERAARVYDAEVLRIRTDVEKQIDQQVRALSLQVQNELSARVEDLRAPARSYLDSLKQARADFEKWFGDLARLAGRRAEQIPPPPAFPEPPPELVRALDSPVPPLDVPAHLDIRVEPRAPKAIAAPTLPDIGLDVPKLDLPATPPLGAALGVEEVAVGGGATSINSFDQQVPGFSVTFLLLGLLLGVSLGLLDERDWGTLDRLRAMPIAPRNVLLGKLTARFVVGMAQMILLFAVGYFVFGVSLGPQPWALLLPIAGIVFAGTAFGLIVAGLARTRDAVLPLGAIVIMSMAAIGGCWWPIDLEPRWLRTIALALPTTWAMESFNDLMIRLRGVDAALKPTAVLVAYGLAYLAIGLWLFRRRLALR